MQIEENFINDIKSFITAGRNQAYAAVNANMVQAYWKIGERIVAEEQKEKQQPGDGDLLIRELSKQLGKEFTLSNLKDYREFYNSFPSPTKP